MENLLHMRKTNTCISAIFLLLNFFPSTSYAEVYRCLVGNKMVFQDYPCEQDNNGSAELSCPEDISTYKQRVLSNQSSTTDRLCVAQIQEKKQRKLEQARELQKAEDRKKQHEANEKARIEMNIARIRDEYKENTDRAEAIQNAKDKGLFYVEYLIEGSAYSANLTLRNESGGTEQIAVQLPWKKSFTAKRGSFVYISAQNNSVVGNISVSIKLNGAVVKASQSSAEYGIASASGHL